MQWGRLWRLRPISQHHRPYKVRRTKAEVKSAVLCKTHSETGAPAYNVKHNPMIFRLTLRNVWTSSWLCVYSFILPSCVWPHPTLCIYRMVFWGYSSGWIIVSGEESDSVMRSLLFISRLSMESALSAFCANNNLCDFCMSVQSGSDYSKTWRSNLSFRQTFPASMSAVAVGGSIPMMSHYRLGIISHEKE